MTVKRMTAKKVMIKHLVNGKWVKSDGTEPSFVVTTYGDKVSRARILGTVVAKFISEDESYGTITIDDCTETIRAKTFTTVKPIEEFNVGDVVDVIGRVREYNGEIYIMPEVIRKVDDPNFELLRKLEIAKTIQEAKTLTCKEEKREEKKQMDIETLKKEILKFLETFH